MKVGGGYKTPQDIQYYWTCDNDGTNFRYHLIAEDGFSFVDSEPVYAPEIKCWGDVAHLMGEDTVVCKECKQRGELTHAGWQQLKEKELCFSCNFWVEKLNSPEQPRFITRSFDCYSIAEEPTAESWKKHKGGLGMGGRRYEFELHNGDIVVSHNVWHGGVVPEHFRDRFPVNCTILAHKKEWYEF